MLVAFVAMGAVNTGSDMPTYQWLAEHAELGVVEAAAPVHALWHDSALLIGGLLSTMSALNATTFSSTRVSFAMGRDRNLPNAFAAIHPRTRTPYKALMISGALIMAMAVAIPIEDVAAAADIMFLLLFLQVNLAAITIRHKYGDRLRYGFLMPFFPIVPIIGVLCELFLAAFMFNFSPLAWYFTAGWIVAGLVIFYLYARPRIRSRSRTPIILQEQRVVEVEPPRYTVLAPIANPDSLQSLLRPAIAAARQHSGRVLLLHVITVPEFLPLSAGRQYVEQSRTLTNQAVAMVEAADVPVEVLVRIAHEPAEAIIQTTFERAIDLLIMGWRGQSRSSNTFLGRNIDRIVEQVNCEVLVMQQRRPPPFHRFLVPIADPLQTKQAIRTAQLLAANGERPEGEQAAHQIDVVHIFHPNVAPARRDRFTDAIKLQLDGIRADFGAVAPYRIDFMPIEGSDVVGAIADAAVDHDCIILGATRDSWLKQQLFGNTPAQIAAKVDAPVMLVGPKANPLGFGITRMIHYVRGGYRRIEPAVEKDLQEQGFLRPRGEGSQRRIWTPPHQSAVLIAGLFAIAAIVAMYFGYGRATTWVGAVVYLLALAWFTYLVVQDVGRQAGQPDRVSGQDESAG